LSLLNLADEIKIYYLTARSRHPTRCLSQRFQLHQLQDFARGKHINGVTEVYYINLCCCLRLQKTFLCSIKN